jgi:Asp-tRNA(Asn)/Glu-tRNA(Gln) amidotransferase A subunit family amidase
MLFRLFAMANVWTVEAQSRTLDASLFAVVQSLGNPAAVVPWRPDDGLPIGADRKAWEEERVPAVAAVLGKQEDGQRRRKYRLESECPLCNERGITFDSRR